MREMKIPRTSILKVSLEILSVFRIIKMAAVHTVKLTKSGLIKSTKQVKAEYIPRTIFVSVNQGTTANPSFYAMLLDTASILFAYCISFSLYFFSFSITAFSN